jgi:hypothetical protein
MSNNYTPLEELMWRVGPVPVRAAIQDIEDEVHALLQAIDAAERGQVSLDSPEMLDKRVRAAQLKRKRDVLVEAAAKAAAGLAAYRSQNHVTNSDERGRMNDNERVFLGTEIIVSPLEMLTATLFRDVKPKPKPTPKAKKPRKEAEEVSAIIAVYTSHLHACCCVLLLGHFMIPRRRKKMWRTKRK